MTVHVTQHAIRRLKERTNLVGKSNYFELIKAIFATEKDVEKDKNAILYQFVINKLKNRECVVIKCYKEYAFVFHKNRTLLTVLNIPKSFLN